MTHQVPALFPQPSRFGRLTSPSSLAQCAPGIRARQSCAGHSTSWPPSSGSKTRQCRQFKCAASGWSFGRATALPSGEVRQPPGRYPPRSLEGRISMSVSWSVRCLELQSHAPCCGRTRMESTKRGHRGKPQSTQWCPNSERSNNRMKHDKAATARKDAGGSLSGWSRYGRGPRCIDERWQPSPCSVYAAATGHRRVVKIMPDGKIETVSKTESMMARSQWWRPSRESIDSGEGERRCRRTSG